MDRHMDGWMDGQVDKVNDSFPHRGPQGCGCITETGCLTLFVITVSLAWFWEEPLSSGALARGFWDTDQSQLV